jgi:hypothetical protein
MGSLAKASSASLWAAARIFFLSDRSAAVGQEELNITLREIKP